MTCSSTLDGAQSLSLLKLEGGDLSMEAFPHEDDGTYLGSSALPRLESHALQGERADRRVATAGGHGEARHCRSIASALHPAG
jgi:hypothetical protein